MLLPIIEYDFILHWDEMLSWPLPTHPALVNLILPLEGYR